jgi:hypothetical protein
VDTDTARTAETVRDNAKLRAARWFLPMPKKWRVKSWISSQLYVSGLTSNGGSVAFTSEGITARLPRLRSVWHGARQYVLWRPVWWWECHIRQGWRLRGRHWPEEPFISYICAACLPCPECGAHRSCEDDCPLVVEYEPEHIGSPGAV